jgi:hypothetical protein
MNLSGFTIVPNSIVVAPMSLYDLRLWIGLNMHADKQGRCWPSLSTLEVELGMSRRQLSRSIARLEKRGLLLIVRRSHVTSTLYEVLGRHVASKTPAPPATRSDRSHEAPAVNSAPCSVAAMPSPHGRQGVALEAHRTTPTELHSTSGGPPTPFYNTGKNTITFNYKTSRFEGLTAEFVAKLQRSGSTTDVTGALKSACEYAARHAETPIANCTAFLEAWMSKPWRTKRRGAYVTMNTGAYAGQIFRIGHDLGQVQENKRPEPVMDLKKCGIRDD